MLYQQAYTFSIAQNICEKSFIQPSLSLSYQKVILFHVFYFPSTPLHPHFVFPTMIL